MKILGKFMGFDSNRGYGFTTLNDGSENLLVNKILIHSNEF